MAYPWTFGRCGVFEKSCGAIVPPILWRKHAAFGRMQLGRRIGATLDPYGSYFGLRNQRSPYFQSRSLLFRHQWHIHIQQSRLACQCGTRGHRGGGSQLPQIEFTRYYYDGSSACIPCADPQLPRHHRPNSKI